MPIDLFTKIIVNTNGTELTTGQLTALITYSIQILFSLMMVTPVNGGINTAGS